MSNENMREDFEAWAGTRYDLQKDENGEYLFAIEYCAWKAWQACAAKYSERIAELEQQVAKVNSALKYTIDDLMIRAKLSNDDSLDIGQGCLDQMHEALDSTAQTDEAYKRRISEPILDAWDDLLEDLELHGMHDFEPYKRSKNKFKEMAAKLREGE